MSSRQPAAPRPSSPVATRYASEPSPMVETRWTESYPPSDSALATSQAGWGTSRIHPNKGLSYSEPRTLCTPSGWAPAGPPQNMINGKSIAAWTENTRNFIENLYGWVLRLAPESQSRSGGAASIATIVQTLERDRAIDEPVVPVQKMAR